MRRTHFAILKCICALSHFGAGARDWYSENVTAWASHRYFNDSASFPFVLTTALHLALFPTLSLHLGHTVPYNAYLALKEA